jgi:hypothetical protein
LNETAAAETEAVMGNILSCFAFKSLKIGSLYKKQGEKDDKSSFYMLK